MNSKNLVKIFRIALTSIILIGVILGLRHLVKNSRVINELSKTVPVPVPIPTVNYSFGPPTVNSNLPNFNVPKSNPVVGGGNSNDIPQSFVGQGDDGRKFPEDDYKKDESYYVGRYESVTERYCELNIHLKPNSKGVATKVCKDDSSESSKTSFIITWSITDQGLLLVYKNQEALFHYSTNLTCNSLGFVKGDDTGMYFFDKKDGDNIFYRYGIFYKLTENCKKVEWKD